MKYLLSLSILLLSYGGVHGQVDSTFLFDPHTPYGTLDIRLSKEKGHVYYLREGETFSYRENNDGATRTYLKMTAWDSSPYGEGHLRERSDNTDRFVMNYRLLVPRQYDASFNDGYPLVVVLHGLLERGNCANTDCYHADASYDPNQNVPPAPIDADHQLLNNDYNLVHAGSNYLKASQRNGTLAPDDPSRPPDAYPGFVLFPQNLNGWDGAASEDVIRLIRLLQKKYNIDADRIYLNGISHGGHGAYEVMKRAPWMFAAAALFSAADDGGIVRQKMTHAISSVPLWIFQGALDENPTQDATEEYIAAFRKAGADVRYTLYPNLGHGTWNKALSEPDFFTWMLSKLRTEIHVFGANSTVCRTSSAGTALSLPAGFSSYEWEYNGNVIEGENKHILYARTPGNYRARFLQAGDAAAEWSKWSASVSLEEKEPPTSDIRQIGTLLLPDLNGSDVAVLESANENAYYYWRRGDERLAVGEGEHSSKRIVIKPGVGNGAISLTVAGYDHCPSEPSEPKYVFFNNTAAITLASPFEVTTRSVSPSEVLLTWSDTTTSAKGFEVWRRRVAPQHDSRWVMAGLADADANSFSDKEVLPASSYEYKIRAVNDTERSTYVPGAERGLLVQTSPDTEAPDSPQNLSAHKVGVRSISLAWHASTDNAAVQRYVVYFNGDTTSTTDTTYTLTGLNLNTVYSLEVRAFDHAENLSAPSETVQSDTYLSGIYYTHSTGAWQTLSDIDWSLREFSGVVDDFTLAPRTQEDFFNFMFDGYLSISREGVYQFRMTSDDGSSLSLNDTLLIENDGIHNMHTVTGPIQILKRGPQRLTVRYFDYSMSDTLLIEYKGPDTGKEWVKIPPEVLTSDVITSVEVGQDRDFDFVIFPNPSNGASINLRLSSSAQDAVSVHIYDLSGRLMFANEIPHQATMPIEIPSKLESGLYIISVKHGARIGKKKIVIR